MYEAQRLLPLGRLEEATQQAPVAESEQTSTRPDIVSPTIGVDGRFHFTYRTTDLDTREFVVGKHSCRDFAKDHYLGSGTFITHQSVI
jgi:hypothetical protein